MAYGGDMSVDISPFTLQNRHGKTIYGDVHNPRNSNGLAFVQHGFSGHRQQQHMIEIVRSFTDAGYITVFFDGTNSFGESEGELFDCTPTTHKEDLEDVIRWASGQDFYTEPFILAGHSLGGLSSVLYTQKHPEKVKALAPLASVVAGRLQVEKNKREDLDGFEAWEKRGFKEKENRLKPGTFGRISWNYVVDGLKYDVCPRAPEMKMPILLVVGEDDTSTHPSNQQALYDLWGGPKEIHIIDGVAHTPKLEDDIARYVAPLKAWLRNIDTSEIAA